MLTASLTGAGAPSRASAGSAASKHFTLMPPMIGSVGPQRQTPLQMLRAPGDQARGVGLSQVGAGGPPPPTEVGAVSVSERMVVRRAAASAFDSNPGTQGTAANPPRGHHVDVRA